MRHLVICGTLELLLSPVMAQSDRYFPNVSAEFEVTEFCYDGQGGSDTHYHFYTYSSVPSVLLEGHEWGSISVDGFQAGLIRVDGTQVLYHGTSVNYFPPVPVDTTVVLYDFNLALGDTAYWDPYIWDYAVVTEIDTLTIQGRQRLLFTMDYSDQWLEGIGSLMGLFRPFWPTPLGCSFPALTYCASYLDEDSLTYTICSDMLLGTEKHADSKERIFPNPSSGIFAVEQVVPNKPYRVTDPRGIEVLSGTTTGESTTIRIPNAVPGLYVLIVDGTRTKVIIQ
ncbi:MAG: hypothetical protein LKM36_10610 [Flavobacteriales bacterium]|nr:hypothetical protein [Flavobacteriales bacterium]